jgi:hypothetical protein
MMPEFPRRGLFHDASEAYLGDVSKWVKRAEGMEGYRHYEEKAQRTIYECFDCEMSKAADTVLEEADKLMVRFEAYRGFHLGKCHMFELPDYPVPSHEEILRVGRWVPWSWQTSEAIFLETYRRIRMR